MARPSIATPCPVPSSSGRTIDHSINDTETVVDFTTDFRASLRNTKPRRRQTQALQFTIHEDLYEHEDQAFNSPANAALSQPPRRIKAPRVSLDATGKSNASSKSSPRPVVPASRAQNYDTSALKQAPKRPTARLSMVSQDKVGEATLQLKLPSPKMLRPLRRETIFIPNDDTTMPSMHMNIFSPIKTLDFQTSQSGEAQPQIELTGIAARMAMKRRTRKSIVNSTPYKGPLQPSMRPIQETVSTEDRYGQGGGKENVPPGFKEDGISEFCTDQRHQRNLMRKRQSCKSTTTSVTAPTASSTYKQEALRKLDADKLHANPVWNRGARLNSSQSTTIEQKTTRTASVPAVTSNAANTKPRMPSRFAIPAVQIESAQKDHAILSDDLARPALYEDNWLQHQEVAITQLMNSLFSLSKHKKDCPRQLLREQTLALYNTDANEVVYRRLQAALLYGALGIPQDTLDQGSRLENDVGMKKRFLDLWICTYDLTALEVALEVVVGRECRPRGSHTKTQTHSTSKTSKSGLRNFIETFVIRNEDARPDQGSKDRTSWSYSRTVLRSLMLVKLLDSIKTDRSVRMSNRLFQCASPYKSSFSVVQALFQMLNPAAGDPLRALNHINYVVSHVQCPLEEFSYEVDNLAVDLRDGVRLTRLVELLLYPSVFHDPENDVDVDCTTTLSLPEGDILQFSESQNWPLSQHVKMSCQSRATRKWNVDLALSAIQNIKGLGSLIEGITADDIVDGFREKTLRLLWALVGKWGLAGLVDWQDVSWEIGRLQKLDSCPTYNDDLEHDTDDQSSSFENCKRQLQRWARAVATSKGVTVRNFTTSFSDGKVFEAIIDEYEKYIPLEHDQMGQKLTLHERLVRLGCSVQFSNLFTPLSLHNQHVFDRDFVLAALAFLCSRLLAPTRQSRAATVIQRAWRHRWSKIAERRKQQKTEIAVACAELVQSKEKHTEENYGICDATSSEDRKMSHLARVQSEVVHDSPSILSPVSVSGLMSPASEDIWLSL